MKIDYQDRKLDRPFGAELGLASLSRICHMSDFPYSVSELFINPIRELVCVCFNGQMKVLV